MLWLLLLLVPVLVIILAHIVLPIRYNWPKQAWQLWRIPGLRTVPFVGNFFYFIGPNEDFLPKMIHVTNKFKPIFRVDFLGANSVVSTELEDIEVIMGSREHITKSEDYDLLLPWLGTGLLTGAGDKWFQHRKWLTPAFHFGILEPYIEVFNKNSSILVDNLRALPAGQPVEINPLIALCTLDIICETAMGTQVNAQLGGEKDYVKATLRMSQLFLLRQLSPWLHRKWIFDLSAIGREQKKVLKILHGFAERVIKERKEAYTQGIAGPETTQSEEFGGKKRMSFLDLLIEISEKGNNLTELEIREEVDTFMFEGHDTTSAAISWALYLIGTHPHVQDRVYHELQYIFQDSDRPPTFQDLQEMKYLERVIKETLRLYPSVPIIARKLDVPITLRGYEIPAGTNIPIFIYYLHRDARIYPDPDKFDPDRFLPEAIQGRHPYSYMPFSAGPRNCIGQKFAMLEEKSMLSTILRNFHITGLDRDENIKVMAEIILRPKDNLRMIFEERSKRSSLD